MRGRLALGLLVALVACRPSPVVPPEPPPFDTKSIGEPWVGSMNDSEIQGFLGKQAHSNNLVMYEKGISRNAQHVPGLHLGVIDHRSAIVVPIERRDRLWFLGNERYLSWRDAKKPEAELLDATGRVVATRDYALPIETLRGIGGDFFAVSAKARGGLAIFDELGREVFVPKLGVAAACAAARWTHLSPSWGLVTAPVASGEGEAVYRVEASPSGPKLVEALPRGAATSCYRAGIVRVRGFDGVVRLISWLGHEIAYEPPSGYLAARRPDGGLFPVGRKTLQPLPFPDVATQPRKFKYVDFRIVQDVAYLLREGRQTVDVFASLDDDTREADRKLSVSEPNAPDPFTIAIARYAEHRATEKQARAAAEAERRRMEAGWFPGYVATLASLVARAEAVGTGHLNEADKNAAARAVYEYPYTYERSTECDVLRARLAIALVADASPVSMTTALDTARRQIGWLPASERAALQARLEVAQKVPFERAAASRTAAATPPAGSSAPAAPMWSGYAERVEAELKRAQAESERIYLDQVMRGQRTYDPNRPR